MFFAAHIFIFLLILKISILIYSKENIYAFVFDDFYYKFRFCVLTCVVALNIYSRMHPSSQYQQTMMVASPLLGENNFIFSAFQCNNAP